MKKLLSAVSIFIFVALLPMSVYASNYEFGESYDDDTFANPTTSSIPADYSAIENIRRNKDVTVFPPPVGAFSGEFDTDPTSKYHTPDANKSKVTQIPDFGGFSDIGSDNAFYNDNGLGETGSDNISVRYINYDGSAYANTNRDTSITMVEKYSDGSIGRLEIPRFDVSAKVYEGTDDATLKKGIGHFDYTSQWDQNVGLASHNRGTGSYFSCLKDMNYGDKVIYTTKEGTRTYRVTLIEKISVNDTSYLGNTYGNTLTMITCVANESNYRWVVQAEEI